MAWWLQNQWSAIERIAEQHARDSTYYTETFARRDQVATNLSQITGDLSRIEAKLDRILLDGYQNRDNIRLRDNRSPDDWKER